MTINTKTPSLDGTQEGVSKTDVLIPSNVQFFCSDVNGWRISGRSATPEIYTGKGVLAKQIYIPITCDTEFRDLLMSGLITSPRKGLTAQFGIAGLTDTYSIYMHPDSKDLISPVNNYPLMTYAYPHSQLLSSMGWEVVESLDEEPDNECRILTSVLYGFFLTAEIDLIFTGAAREFNRTLWTPLSPGDKARPSIESTKRIRYSTPSMGYSKSYVLTPHYSYINGEKFRIGLMAVDIAGVIGNGSYKDAAEVAGVHLPYKDLLSNADKENMEYTMVTKPQDFENYAKGDLFAYEILEGINENIANVQREVYQELGVTDPVELESYIQQVELTMGSTVKKMFETCLRIKLGVNKKDFNGIRHEVLFDSSAANLRTYSKTTKALLAKVFGGRAVNERPNHVYTEGVIIDNDGKGAYASCQRVQQYPIGYPETLSYDLNSLDNLMPIREWLKEYKTSPEKYAKRNYGELVPGNWYAMVTTKPGYKLKTPQTFFQSWYDSSRKTEKLEDSLTLLVKCLNHKNLEDWETEFSDDYQQELDEESGTIKYLLHEITNAPLTHDGLEWILYTCSPKQRDELLDNLYVLTSSVYRKSWRCETREEWLEKIKAGRGTETNKVGYEGDGYTSKKEFNQNLAWYSFPLSDIIDVLTINRQMYPKKTPMNTAYKLMCNTMYGDMTAKFFEIANTLVGNNITGKCRALCWYMTNGHFGFAGITDGTALDANKVVFPKGKKRLYAQDTVLLSLTGKVDKDKRNVRIGTLAGFDSLVWRGKTEKYVPYKEKDYKKDLKKREENPSHVIPEFDEVTYVNDDGEEVTERFIWLSVNLIEVNGISYTTDEVKSLFEKKLMKHLQTVYPNVSVLHEVTPFLSVNEEKEVVREEKEGQLEFEMKDFYSAIVTTATCDYTLYQDGKPKEVKKRSHRNRMHEVYIITDGEPVLVRQDFKPGQEQHDKLSTNPSAIERAKPHVIENIVKVNDMRHNHKRLSAMGLNPGDSVKSVRLMRELSLSQFYFQCRQQRAAWEQRYEKDREIYGQSLERAFLNADGTLDYARMVQEVQEAILREVPTKERQSRHPVWGSEYDAMVETKNEKGEVIAKNEIKHPYYEDYLKLKQRLIDNSVSFNQSRQHHNIN